MKVSNQIRSNDNLKLTPGTRYRDPVLKFDFPGLKIGVGEYVEGPTGCTTFHFAERAFMTSDIRGGVPGIIGAHYNIVDAIVFAGGSLFGLEAVTGVTTELLKTQKYMIDWDSVPVVAGAIIYDWRPRPENAVYPDKFLGSAAIQSARDGIFPLGNQGAGVSATVGKIPDFSFHEKGGQGGAVGQFGPTKIIVFSVVNALGALYDRQGNVIRGHFDPKKKGYTNLPEIANGLTNAKGFTGNTTLTLVVTNQKFNSVWEFNQIAKQIHASMARAIYPFHTTSDGDVLFMVTTAKVENKQLLPKGFGYLAGELAWDAVMSCFE